MGVFRLKFSQLHDRPGLKQHALLAAVLRSCRSPREGQVWRGWERGWAEERKYKDMESTIVQAENAHGRS